MKTKLISLNVSALLVAFPVLAQETSSTNVGFAEPSHAAIDSIVEATMTQWDVPGLSLTIVANGEAWSVKGYGVRELGKPELVDENTIFSLGSCSKAFASAAVALLVEDGALFWEQRVVDHLPWFRLYDPWTTYELRVKDIVTHRVGTPSSNHLRSLAKDRKDFLMRLPHGDPAHRFRDRFGYTNDMFILSGALVEAVSGKSWDEFVRTRIWEPLGMGSTSSNMQRVNSSPNHALPHVFQERLFEVNVTPGPELVTVPWEYRDDVAVPSGGVASSANDMVKWIKFHVGVEGMPAILPATTVDLLHAPHTVVSSPAYWMMHEGPGAYAMGWATGQYLGRTVVSHGGNATGFNSSVTLVPEERFGIFVSVNRNSYVPWLLPRIILDQFFASGEGRDWHARYFDVLESGNARRQRGEEHRLAGRIEGAGPSLPLDMYTGTYHNDYAGSLQIRLGAEGERAVPIAPPAQFGNWYTSHPLVRKEVVPGERGHRLFAELDGRDGPIVLQLDRWHIDQFDAYLGHVRVHFSFTIDERGQVTSVALDYFGDFERIGG